MKIFVVDASNLIHRAFHAMSEMCGPNGFPTGAIYGFLSMVDNLVTFYDMEHVAMCFDVSKSSDLRKAIYPDYKANRIKEGVNLVGPQIRIIKRLIQEMGVLMYGIPGYEADDCVATLKDQILASIPGSEVVVVSSDKDLMVLVDERTVVLDTMKKKTYQTQDVIEKWGVQPTQISDYLALVGDASDNIPGCKGVGPVAAKAILKLFNDIESVYENIDDPALQKYAAKLKGQEDVVRMSKQLSLLRHDAPIVLDVDGLIPKPVSMDNVRTVLGRLGFQDKTIKNLTGWVDSSESLLDLADLIPDLTGPA